MGHAERSVQRTCTGDLGRSGRASAIRGSGRLCAVPSAGGCRVSRNGHGPLDRSPRRATARCARARALGILLCCRAVRCGHDPADRTRRIRRRLSGGIRDRFRERRLRVLDPCRQGGVPVSARLLRQAGSLGHGPRIRGASGSRLRPARAARMPLVPCPPTAGSAAEPQQLRGIGSPAGVDFLRALSWRQHRPPRQAICRHHCQSRQITVCRT